MREKYTNILFEWDSLDFDSLKKICDGISPKMLRWLAMIHPDNRTRENLLRFSNIIIGKNTVINIGLNLYDTSEPVAEIGCNCALAANVSLIAESGPNMSELGDIPYIREHYMTRGKIIIEDHVWIGANAIIFPGVKIGRGSIVGAGSIVTKDIPPYCIVRGQPARVVKKITEKGVQDI